MDTEILTEQQQSVDRTYFIVFDTNGKIRKINSSPGELKDESLTQIESTNPICKKLIKGNASLKKYGVIWDIVNEKWEIDRTDTRLTLKTIATSKIVQFDHNIDKKSAEIFVSIYTSDNTVVVYANKNRIKGMKNLTDIQEISTNKTDILDIFLTKKNDPDYLRAILKLDPLTLFVKGSQVINLDTNIIEHVDWNNMSMYTKPIFNNYGCTLIGQKYKEAGDVANTVLQSQNAQDKDIININVVDNVLYAKSHLASDRDHYFEDYRYLKVLVCDNSPDKLAGAFELPVDVLLSNENYNTKIDFKWPKKPLLLYKNNYITIRIKEIT